MLQDDGELVYKIDLLLLKKLLVKKFNKEGKNKQ